MAQPKSRPLFSENSMAFDFKTFAVFAAKAYKELGKSPYTLDEVLSVFICYFQTYEEHRNAVHPFLKPEQIKRIIGAMPYLNPKDKLIEILPEEYPAIIEQHFKTQYRSCDYNINHFFSGMIRELRYYERIYFATD